MNEKVYISYNTAKDFLLDILKNNDFSTDEDIQKAFSTVTNKIATEVVAENLSKVLVDKHVRIYFPEYSAEELKLPFLPKTVFLFFLFHPEGYHFKHLSDCQEELCRIYQIVAIDKNTDALRIRKYIGNLVEPVNNRIYEICSVIRRKLSLVVHPAALEQYCIVGKRGNKHQVNIHRSMVYIENEELKRIALF